MEDFKLCEGAAESLAALKHAGFLLIVATNQPEVSRGIQRRSRIDSMHEFLMRALPLDEIRVCFHDDADDCPCRKPKSGLLVEAARDRSIALSDSYMVGDREKDIEAGRGAGCRTVLISAPYNQAARTAADARVRNLHEAAVRILGGRSTAAQRHVGSHEPQLGI